MKKSNKYSLIILSALIITSVILPSATAVVADFTTSSVSVSAGDVLVYKITDSNETSTIGDKMNMTITELKMNTTIDGDIVLNITILEGYYNHTTGKWGAPSLKYYYYNASTSLQPKYKANWTLFIIPIPVNLTWINESWGGAIINGNKMTFNTPGGTFSMYTYNNDGICTLFEYTDIYFNVIKTMVLDTGSGTTGGGGPGIPFGNFYLGFLAASIIGMIVMVVKKHKINMKS